MTVARVKQNAIRLAPPTTTLGPIGRLAAASGIPAAPLVIQQYDDRFVSGLDSLTLQAPCSLASEYRLSSSVTFISWKPDMIQRMLESEESLLPSC